jgi:hypothetical protein
MSRILPQLMHHIKALEMRNFHFEPCVWRIADSAGIINSPHTRAASRVRA